MTECKNGCPAFQLDVDGEGPALVLWVCPPFDYMIYRDIQLALSQESHVFISMYAKKKKNITHIFCLSASLCMCVRVVCTGSVSLSVFLVSLAVTVCAVWLVALCGVCGWCQRKLVSLHTHTHTHTHTHARTHMNTQASLTDIL